MALDVQYAANLLAPIQRFIDDLSLDLQLLILHCDTPWTFHLPVIVKDLQKDSADNIPSKILKKSIQNSEHEISLVSKM